MAKIRLLQWSNKKIQADHLRTKSSSLNLCVFGLMFGQKCFALLMCHGLKASFEKALHITSLQKHNVSLQERFPL